MRGDTKSSSVPVIFISSASDNMNIIMAMNMGGDDFVAKPSDHERAHCQGAGSSPPDV